MTADKYQVRSYLRKVLGEKKAREILIPLLYVTDKPETIPFESLPPDFIVKPNHASGLKIIVNNSNYNKKEMVKNCKKWLRTPYFLGLEKMEWAYQSIKRKIIVEKLLCDHNGNIPKEFKFYIFHGKCKLVYVILDRIHDLSRSFYDEEWNFLSIKKLNRPQGAKIEKPEKYEMMLKLAEKLSEAFDYIRVDFYDLNGKIYFGELTHYPVSGIGKFEPSSFDLTLGKYWKIEPEYWKSK